MSSAARSPGWPPLADVAAERDHYRERWADVSQALRKAVALYDEAETQNDFFECFGRDVSEWRKMLADPVRRTANPKDGDK